MAASIQVHVPSHVHAYSQRAVRLHRIRASVHLTSAVAVLVCVAEGEVLALVGDYALGSVRDSVIDLVSHVHEMLFVFAFYIYRFKYFAFYFLCTDPPISFLHYHTIQPRYYLFDHLYRFLYPVSDHLNTKLSKFQFEGIMLNYFLLLALLLNPFLVADHSNTKM